MSSNAVVADTMVVSALLQATRRPEPAARYRALIGDRPVVVSFVTITEIRYGARKAEWGQLRTRALERDLAKFSVAQPDDAMTVACAELRVQCEWSGRALGQKVHEADRWVAATAIRLNIALVSDDVVFRDVRGLRVVHH